MILRIINKKSFEMARTALGSISQPTIASQQKQSSIDYSTTKQYAKLPKFPVPDPSNTLKSFLEFAKPLQSPKEFKETENVVASFSGEEMKKLQKLLEVRATKHNNWLTPWWLDIAYLAARSPLPVVTSPGVCFPFFGYSGAEGQIEYAAKITQAALQFYRSVMSHDLPQDMAGKTPFDMSQYKFLFGTTRIPRVGVDEIAYGNINENKQRHITVVRNGNLFAVDVLDKSGEILSLKNLEENFAKVYAESSNRDAHRIGIVTSDNRDKWARSYEELKKDAGNAANLKSIEDSLFVVCLDKGSEPQTGYTASDEQARQVLHGCGYEANSSNRWFDKTIQFVIGETGYCGMNYEHTPAEGPPVAALMDFICDQIKSKNFNEVDNRASTNKVKLLAFNLNKTVTEQIEKSAAKMDAVVNDIDLVTYSFRRYGKNFPKSVKISPDSYIQMAFQLAFYRIHGAVPPTYETATLRKFDEGRTENIRSPNTFAQQFVKKMASGRSPIADLYDALKVAADKHKQYTVDCMNGSGMDRHLLAWNLLASENNLPKPSILNLPVYQHMTHFQVSTSQVPTKNFIQMCFGPSAPDCYGICYNPQEKELHFTISTFRSDGSTSSKKFTKELERALNDMNSVCSKALKEQAKL